MGSHGLPEVNREMLRDPTAASNGVPRVPVCFRGIPRDPMGLFVFVPTGSRGFYFPWDCPRGLELPR